MAREWIYNDGGYIDPGHHAGSMVVGRISRPVVPQDKGDSYVRFEAELLLSDCDRSIRWHFHSNDESLTKLRNAIDRLQRFERALIEGQRQFAVVSQKARERFKRQEAKRERKAAAKRAAKPDAAAAPAVRVVGPWPELP